jgi:uncharacterized membrane protein HdeD (DUF308 family)
VEDNMTAYGTPSMAGTSAPPTWIRILLGIVMILAGFLVLGDVVLATIISTLFIGIMAVAAGVFEIIHAFWTKGWGGFLWQILLGALYIVFGVVIFREPVSGALVLTYVLGLTLLISGVFRIVIGFSRWRDAGWIMILSGAFGALAGLVILAGWPVTGLWVIGLFVGIDLISHGVAWLAYAWFPAGRAA